MGIAAMHAAQAYPPHRGHSARLRHAGNAVVQAASTEPYVAVPAGGHETVSRTLHIQAAKVTAAHAASIGDALLGVPLLCSAGALTASSC